LWPSFLGFLLVCLALFTLSRREVSSEVAAVVVVLFAALPCVNEMAGLSTPDALGACLLLFAIVQLSRPISSVRGILLLSLAIGVRADNGIMAGLLLLAQPWYAPSRKLPRKSLVIGMLTLVVIYLIVDRIACAHGWCVRPAYSFLPHTLHPGAVHVDMTMERYIAAMRKGFDSLTYTWVVEFSVLATFGLFTTMIRRDRTFNSNHRLLAVITLAVIIRYLLFPIPDDRALIPWYVAITLIMVPEILSAYELIASMIAKPRKSLPNPTTP
jgi:multisubunit Na+/H+ antiporter MnhE subunit